MKCQGVGSKCLYFSQERFRENIQVEIKNICHIFKPGAYFSIDFVKNVEQLR